VYASAPALARVKGGKFQARHEETPPIYRRTQTSGPRCLRRTCETSTVVTERSPSIADAQRVAAFPNSLGGRSTAAVVRRDWERTGFDLAADAVVLEEAGSVVGFGAAYPDGWLMVGAARDDLFPRLLQWTSVRAQALSYQTQHFLVNTREAVLLTAARDLGYEPAGSFLTYEGATSQRVDTTSKVTIRPATRGSDEIAVFELMRAEYGDGPDFDSWRRWITNWRFEAACWLIALDEAQVVGAAVGIPFPDEGWVKRLAALGEQRVPICSALLNRLLLRFADLGYSTFGLPVGSDEPAYLHDMAAAAGLVMRDELVHLARQTGA
jgi:hypothetical protein